MSKPHKVYEVKRVNVTLNHDISGSKSPLNSTLNTPTKNGPSPHTTKNLPSKFVLFSILLNLNLII